jgi:hypothetical protein
VTASSETLGRQSASSHSKGPRLGCATDDVGFVTVDTTGRTSTFGVWAAGNVVDPRAQVIASAGAGSSAAIAINADLVQEDIERAVDAHHVARISRPLWKRSPALPCSEISGTGSSSALDKHRAVPVPQSIRSRRPQRGASHTQGLHMPTDPAYRTPTPIPPPSKHQLALMSWIAVLPTFTVLNLALSNLLTNVPIVSRTVVLATIAVPIVMYGLCRACIDSEPDSWPASPPGDRRRTARPCAGAVSPSCAEPVKVGGRATPRSLLESSATCATGRSTARNGSSGQQAWR